MVPTVRASQMLLGHPVANTPPLMANRTPEVIKSFNVELNHKKLLVLSVATDVVFLKRLHESLPV